MIGIFQRGNTLDRKRIKRIDKAFTYLVFFVAPIKKVSIGNTRLRVREWGEPIQTTREKALNSVARLGKVSLDSVRAL